MRGTAVAKSEESKADTSRAAQVAREAGEKAYREGTQRGEVPSGYRAARGLDRAFREGWETAARAAHVAHREPEVEAQDVEERDRAGVPTHREPEVTSGDVSVKNRSLFWPEGKPIPATRERALDACPSCRRVLTDTRGRAALVSHTRGRTAYMSCRCCGHRWKLDIVQA